MIKASEFLGCVIFDFRRIATITLLISLVKVKVYDNPHLHIKKIVDFVCDKVHFHIIKVFVAMER